MFKYKMYPNPLNIKIIALKQTGDSYLRKKRYKLANKKYNDAFNKFDDL